MSHLENRFTEVFMRLEDAAIRAKRSPRDVTLVAVTKRQPIEKILQYLEYCNSRNIPAVLGENYVQEWEEKLLKLKVEYPAVSVPEVHFIGTLQRNKAKRALESFQVFQSVHSVALLEKLGSSRDESVPPLPVFLQVNISHDESKAGLLPEVLFETLKDQAHLWNKKIALRGLMTITALQTREETGTDFQQMSSLRARILSSSLKEYFENEQVQLSMGMSDDFELAIECGASHVRVGSLLFGERG